MSSFQGVPVEILTNRVSVLSLGWTLKRLFRVKTLADKTDRFWLIHVHVGLINTGKIFEEVFYRKTTTKSPVSTWCDGN